MVKKDYELIAKVLRKYRSEEVTDDIIDDLSAALLKDNPSFNKGKFITAIYGG